MMKKTITILLSLGMIFCLAACGNSAGQAESPSAESSSAENGAGNDAGNSTDGSADTGSNIDDDVKTGNSADDDADADSSAGSDVQTQSSGTQTETEGDGQPESAEAGDTENAGASGTQQTEAGAPETQGSKVLVAYFSATGTTEGVAEHIANGLNADIYEIIPEEPYTDADLNYNDNNSRSTMEMNDPASRPAISSSVENMGQYDIVFIGFPIWWGEAPRIVSTFVESYDFSGKTVVPFCTSGGSGVGSSASNLEQLTSDAAWMEGHRLNGSDSQETVMEWVNGLGLGLGE